MKRRQLFQGMGGAIAVLGLNQLDLHQKAMHYGRVLAQDTPRKRALLVGINQYTGTDKGEWLPLKGAVNDVELQRELLTLRFGFKDIQVLTDQAATREAILKTFNEFLIQDAKPGDVVVFHFSGHGSNVIDPNKVHQDGLNGTLVPYGSDLPFGYPNVGGTVNDITAGTLFLLMAALKLKGVTNVTVVLDSCYAGAGVRGNLIVRSRPGQFELRGTERTSKLEIAPEELQEQQRWLKNLNLSQEEWIKLRRDRIANGVAILAAQRNQQAVDAVFADNIHAGVFTQALTRYLWQQSEAQTLTIVMNAAQAKTEKFLKTVPNSRLQTPYSEVALGSGNDQKPIFFSSFNQKGAADAVIKRVDGDRVKVLLTVDPTSVEALGRGAQLKLVDGKGTEIGMFRIESRNQLEAEGTLQVTGATRIRPGDVLQEQIRAIPKNVTLRIGLDRSLEPDLEAAKRSLQTIPRIEAVSLLQQEVHYILARTNGRIGLYSPGLDPLPDDTAAVKGEAIADAITRLRSKLNMLLAARILKLMLNTNSSQLKVSAAVKVADKPELLAQAFTVRGGSKPIQTIQSRSGASAQALSRLRVGQKLQIVVQNQEARDLYIGIVLFSPNGSVLPLAEQVASPNQEVRFPAQGEIELQPPLGVAEVLVIASTVSLEKALTALAALRSEQSSQRGAATVNAVDQLLEDLDAGTRGATRSPSDVRLVDTRQMAALAIGVEIV